MQDCGIENGMEKRRQSLTFVSLNSPTVVPYCDYPSRSASIRAIRGQPSADPRDGQPCSCLPGLLINTWLLPRKPLQLGHAVCYAPNRNSVFLGAIVPAAASSRPPAIARSFFDNPISLTGARSNDRALRLTLLASRKFRHAMCHDPSRGGPGGPGACPGGASRKRPSSKVAFVLR